MPFSKGTLNCSIIKKLPCDGRWNTVAVATGHHLRPRQHIDRLATEKSINGGVTVTGMEATLNGLSP